MEGLCACLGELTKDKAGVILPLLRLSSSERGGGVVEDEVLGMSSLPEMFEAIPSIGTQDWGKSISSCSTREKTCQTKKGKKSETPRMDDLASALEGVQLVPDPAPGQPVPAEPNQAEPNPADPVPADPVPADPVPDQAELEDDIPNGWRKFGDVGELFDQTDNSRFVGLPREFLRADKKVKFWGRKPAVFADEKDYFFAHIERNRLIEKPKHEFHFLVSVRDPDELIIFNSITAINRVLKARAYQINWIIPIGRYI
eukprot:g81313.t1